MAASTFPAALPSLDTASIPPAALRANLNIPFRGLTELRFHAVAVNEDLLVEVETGWDTTASLDDFDGEIISELSVLLSSRQERVVRIGDTIAHLHAQGLRLSVRVAARNREDCDAALTAIRAALPDAATAETDILVRFWWWQRSGAESATRSITAPAWAELGSNYSTRTIPSVSDLMTWTAPPSAGGRLILWHGAPGTGKTTALRALARSWRDWAGFHFITDPEQFLSNPSYLMQALTERAAGAEEPWRIFVLEDAGEYLAPDAKQATGQGLSRLLNVCDGVLGQGARCLVLATTNEPLSSLHPALSRPGRCVAENEFHELGRAEIEQWCRLRGVPILGQARASLADLFAHADGRVTARSDSGFGFSVAGA